MCSKKCKYCDSMFVWPNLPGWAGTWEDLKLLLALGTQARQGQTQKLSLAKFTSNPNFASTYVRSRTFLCCQFWLVIGYLASNAIQNWHWFNCHFLPVCVSVASPRPCSSWTELALPDQVWSVKDESAMFVFGCLT